MSRLIFPGGGVLWDKKALSTQSYAEIGGLVAIGNVYGNTSGKGAFRITSCSWGYLIYTGDIATI